MKAVHVQFISHPKKNEQAARDTKSQTCNVDKRKNFVSPEIT
jgi:hypothetical protein